MASLLPTVRSLANMVREMARKDLELKRLTKSSSLLILSGLTRNSIPVGIIEKTIRAQHSDGGWVSIVDTMWNTLFLTLIDEVRHSSSIESGLRFLRQKKNCAGLWGRSQRDMSRIPVTGPLLHFFPVLATVEELGLLEELWLSERNSLTYKAAYCLMAFAANAYEPHHVNLIDETVVWLAGSQKEDGGFSPWKEHPVDSDVFCTSIAVLGLLQYPEKVPPGVLQGALQWLESRRLKSGIWAYHEIDDGASWGLYALSKLSRCKE